MAEELKNKGNDALSAGKIDEALAFYTEALKLNPTKEYYGNRSLAYVKAGKFTEALADAEKCVAADPNWLRGYQRKGTALQNLKRYAEAVAAFKKGLELEPNNAQIKQSLEDAEKLAKWEHDQQKREEAAQEHFKALNKYFEGDVLGRCRLMEEVKHLVDDVEFVKIVSEIQDDPKKLQAYRSNGKILAYIQVATQYEHLSKMTDEERAKLFLKQEEIRLRAEKLEEEERDRKRREEEQRKKEEEKRRKAEEEAKLSPIQREALQLKQQGNAYYDKKDFAKALELYQQAHEKDPTNIVYLNNIAAVYMSQQNYDKCIETCLKAEQVGRDNRAPFQTIATALQRLGKAYSKKEDFENAISAFNKAKMEHRDPETLKLLSEIEKKYEEKKIKEYINPELSVKAKEEGNELFKQKRYVEAVERYTEAIKRDPSNHVLYTNRATAYTKLQAYSEALKDCDKCIEMNPKFIKAYLRKGAVYAATKQFQKCFEVYSQALEIDPNNVEVLEEMRKVDQQLNTQQVDPEQVARNIEKDPELQKFLQDPGIQQVLTAIRTKQPYQHFLADPKIKEGLMKLAAAGLIRVA